MASLTSSMFGSRVALQAAAPRSNAPAGPRQVTTCMAKKKGVRVIVTIECTESRKEGLTPSRYVTEKNRKNSPEKLELMKYNKFLKRRTLHREIK